MGGWRKRNLRVACSRSFTRWQPNRSFIRIRIPLGEDKTKYRKVEGSEKYVSVASFEGNEILKVDPEALTILANEAMRDISFLLRPEHNE